MKEVHREFQIIFREKDPLWFTRASRRTKGNDLRYVVLAYSQETKGIKGEIGWAGERKRRKIGESSERHVREGGETITIERRVATGMIDRLVQAPDLVTAEFFAKDCPLGMGIDLDFLSYPLFKGGPNDQGGFPFPGGFR
jgi:hypothetical protein